MPTNSYECLSQLVDTFKQTDECLHTKGTHFALTILKMELDLHKRGGVSDDVYLKLCGNNVRVTSYRLHDVDVPPILAAICSVPIITMLDLRYNRLTDEGAVTIGSFLKVIVDKATTSKEPGEYSWAPDENSVNRFIDLAPASPD
ncbi:unnamed protein product [Dibothriocephalus latus]|uniref:Uncharacterized protein n=1 Tax=Dibothriocephalus latus TaxID=60516 RepID=A0A3P6TS11_DIBLA|nr:unnamed protein product [Dibothriocephalus latus]